MIINYLVLLHVNLVFSQNFSPNVRYHGQHAEKGLNYSYINLKYLRGYKLAVTPLLATSVQNRTECVRKCLSTKGVCKSINIERVNDASWDCEILASDVYSSPGKLVNNSKVTHSIIAVSQRYFSFKLLAN